jgi:hypothetical protein
LYWQLTKMGVDCEVIAPSIIPKKARDEVKTGRRDAEKLAKSGQAGDLNTRHFAISCASARPREPTKLCLVKHLLRRSLRPPGESAWTHPSQARPRGPAGRLHWARRRGAAERLAHDKKICRLDLLEFMRRVLLHVLPLAFVKIRHFGLYAAGNVNSKLAVACAAIERQAEHVEKVQRACSAAEVTSLDWLELFHRVTGIALGSCPHCGSQLTSAPLPQPSHVSRRPPSVQS